jgi:HK97 gp10 family phage protein
MDDPVVKITGLAELQKALSDLPARIEANVVRGALKAGAQVMVDEAKRQVPVASGTLRDSIHVSSRITKRTGKVTGNVVARARHAHLVEFGTAAHWIKPKARRSLFVAGLLRDVVHHPGARAKPFMRPALDRGWQPAIERFAQYAEKRVAKEIEKARRK